MRRGLAVLILVGLLSACGSSGPARVAARPPTSTTEAPTTTTLSSASPSSTATGTAPPSYTSTFAYGGTQTVTVTFTPGGGPPGTPIHVTGHGFTDMVGDEARAHAYFFALSNEQIETGCSLMSANDQSPDPQVHIDQAGGLTGSFRVPARGYCFQQNGSDRPLPPGTYGVILGPHAAYIGELRLTAH